VPQVELKADGFVNLEAWSHSSWRNLYRPQNAYSAANLFDKGCVPCSVHYRTSKRKPQCANELTPAYQSIADGNAAYHVGKPDNVSIPFTSRVAAPTASRA
jgi:hypothetical protein